MQRRPKLGQSKTADKIIAELKSEYDLTSKEHGVILEQLRRAIIMLEETQKAVEAEGLTVSGAGGTTKEHPAVKMYQRAMDQIVSYTKRLEIHKASQINKIQTPFERLFVNKKKTAS